MGFADISRRRMEGYWSLGSGGPVRRNRRGWGCGTVSLQLRGASRGTQHAPDANTHSSIRTFGAVVLQHTELVLLRQDEQQVCLQVLWDGHTAAAAASS